MVTRAQHRKSSRPRRTRSEEAVKPTDTQRLVGDKGSATAAMSERIAEER